VRSRKAQKKMRGGRKGKVFSCGHKEPHILREQIGGRELKEEGGGGKKKKKAKYQG